MGLKNLLQKISGDPAKRAAVLDGPSLVELGQKQFTKARKQKGSPANHYLFVVQFLARTKEVQHIEPMRRDQPNRPYSTAVCAALLTLEQASRLRLVSRAAGGDGFAKTAEELFGGTPLMLTPIQLFGAEDLDAARPEKVGILEG